MSEQAPATPPAPPATAAEAATRLAELQANSEWAAKVISKTDGYAEKQEFAGLIAMKASGDNVDAILDDSATPPEIELVTDGKMSVRNSMASAAELREIGIADDQIKRLLTGEPLSPADFKTVEQFKNMKLGDEDFVKKLLSGGAEERRLLNLWSIYAVVGQKEAAACRGPLG